MKFVDIILLGVGQIGARLEGCCKCEAGGRKKEGGKMKKILQLRHLPHSHSSLPQLHSFSSCHPDQKHPHHHVSSSSASAGLRETLCNEVQTRGCHVTRKTRTRTRERVRPTTPSRTSACIPTSSAHCRPTGALVIPPWCEATNRFRPPTPPPPPPSTQPRTSRACSALTLSQCQIGDRYTADTAPKG